MTSPTVFSYTVRDELGTEASTLVYANYDGAINNIDSLASAWESYGTLVDAVTSGQIVSGKVTIPLEPKNTWKASPASGSRVEQTALINYRTALASKRQGFSIPSLLNSLIVDGKPNTNSGALHTLITTTLAGQGVATFANAVGQALTLFADAAITFRKHRKQLTRSSETYTD